MDYTKTTLGELLSSPDQTIKRNAISILKCLQNEDKCPNCENTKLVKAKYKNGALWLECENCFSAIKPLNKIAEQN